MAKDNTVDWDAVSFVKRSKYRIKTMEGLADGPATPSDIADGNIAHISRSLNELADREFVELLVEEDVKKGRYYGLTAKGESVLNALKTNA